MNITDGQKTDKRTNHTEDKKRKNGKHNSPLNMISNESFDKERQISGVT